MSPAVFSEELCSVEIVETASSATSWSSTSEALIAVACVEAEVVVVVVSAIIIVSTVVVVSLVETWIERWLLVGVHWHALLVIDIIC